MHRPLARSLLLLALLTALPARAQDGLREEVKHAAPKLTRPPRLLKFVEAPYPPGAVKRGARGTVNLQLELGADGRVRKVVLISSPDAELTAAATAAAKQFLFSPAEVDGKPAPVRIDYAYNFSLTTEFKPRVPAWAEDRQLAEAGADVLVGRVREQGTRLPIPGAAVALRGLGVEVRTDEKGAFAVKQVPPGKHRVEAISLEHRRESIDAEVRAGEQTRIEFYLPRLAANPYETVVRGQRRKTADTRVTLREKELTTVPGTFGDPIRVIENLPGVARVPYVGGALLIRGSPPQDSGVYLDGIKIPLLYHFLGGPSVLSPEFLDRIDYYPGNVEVRYGRLTAGLIDVATRSAFTQQWGGAVDINLLNTGLTLKVPLSKRVSITGAVRRSYIDALLPTILKASGQTATTVAPVYYDYQLRLDVALPNDGQLFFLVFGSDDSIAVVSNEPDRKVDISLDSRISFHRLLASWRWQITPRLVSKMTPSAGIDYITFDGGTASVNLRTLSASLREDLEYRAHKRLTLRGGVDLLFEQTKADFEVPIPVDYRNPAMGLTSPFTTDPQRVGTSQVRLGVAGYVDAIIGLGEHLQLIPGARIELYRYEGKVRFSADPRLTARWAVGRTTTLKGGVGLFSQPPQPQNSSADFGNPNLDPEHTAHFSLGIEQQLLPALRLDAQVYYLHRYDNVVPTRQVRFEDGVLHPVRFLNAGSGYSYGLEVLLKHDVTRRFYGWLSYTLSRSGQQREPGGDYQLYTFDQTHILTLVSSFRLGLGWELGARFRLVSGRPTTPVLGGVFDSDRGRYRQITGEVGSDRMPLFHQLDLRVEKTWFFKLWRLSVYLDVQNIYNAENPEAIVWDYRYRQSGPIRGLPILPSLGLKGSF